MLGTTTGRLLVLALAAGTSVPFLAEKTPLTRFDVPGSTFTSARDINPEGQVVGRYGRADGTTHGYLRDRDGNFTAIDVPGASLTAALGVNPEGDIVGNVRYVGEPTASRHGFVLIDGSFTTIDVPGAKTTNATGINPQRDIVGNYTSADKATHGYRLSGGLFSTIDFPNAIETVAWKITPAGRILGAYVDTSRQHHLYVLTGGAFATIDLPGGAIPTLDAGGLNDRGDIAGWYCDTPQCAGAGDIHGFLLTDGAFHVIDVPGLTCVTPLSMNASGDLTGTFSTNAACTDAHGFVLRREDGGRP